MLRQGFPYPPYLVPTWPRLRGSNRFGRIRRLSRRFLLCCWRFLLQPTLHSETMDPNRPGNCGMGQTLSDQCMDLLLHLPLAFLALQGYWKRARLAQFLRHALGQRRQRLLQPTCYGIPMMAGLTGNGSLGKPLICQFVHAGDTSSSTHLSPIPTVCGRIGWIVTWRLTSHGPTSSCP
jgi:hypothetical protein